MQLVELHLVNTELNIANRFGYEILITLEREKLESYTVDFVELVECKAFNIELSIGLKFAIPFYFFTFLLFYFFTLLSFSIFTLHPLLGA